MTGTGFLPRVVTCSDGSFCCDNDPTCCAENRRLDGPQDCLNHGIHNFANEHEFGHHFDYHNRIIDCVVCNVDFNTEPFA